MRYKKRPVVIDAFEFFSDYPDNFPKWFMDAWQAGSVKFNEKTRLCEIRTLEGTMHVSEGDFVIKGIGGELYPCKPDIFYKTYEREVTDAGESPNGLVGYARRELRILGDEDEEMQQEINKDILDIVKRFANQGHSGFSAAYALGKLTRLLNYKPITPLTGAEDEWMEDRNLNGKMSQQNRRCFSVFRDDEDNSTAYDIETTIFSDDNGETWYSSHKGFTPITFPYMPPTTPNKVFVINDEEKNDTTSNS